MTWRNRTTADLLIHKGAGENESEGGRGEEEFVMKEQTFTNSDARALSGAFFLPVAGLPGRLMGGRESSLNTPFQPCSGFTGCLETGISRRNLKEPASLGVFTSLLPIECQDFT